MFYARKIGNRDSRSTFSHIPRAVVGIIVGLGLVLAQGQSEASPMYWIDLNSSIGHLAEVASSAPLNQSVAIEGTPSIAGGAKAGPEGLGAFSRTSVTQSPFGSILLEGNFTATASMALSDIMITPLPGTAASSYVPGSLNLHLSGSFLNVADRGLSESLVGAASVSAVTVDVGLQGTAVSTGHVET